MSAHVGRGRHLHSTYTLAPLVRVTVSHHGLGLGGAIGAILTGTARLSDVVSLQLGRRGGKGARYSTSTGQVRVGRFSYKAHAARRRRARRARYDHGSEQ